jgi:hypothetical protein
MNVKSSRGMEAIQESDEEAPESAVAAPLEDQAADADTSRSARNILLWRSYLPKDCVDTMIAMGWDQSV